MDSTSNMHHRRPGHGPGPHRSPHQGPGHRPHPPAHQQSCISHWTLEAFNSIRSTPETTFPHFDNSQIQAMVPGMNIWDSWMVLDEDGHIANIGGFRVMIALGEPIGVDQAMLHYFYSNDNEHYTHGGELLPDRLITESLQWSGCTVLRRDGLLQTFYTVSNIDTYKGISSLRQRIASAIQRVAMHTHRFSPEKTLRFSAPLDHRMILSADGYHYQTLEQMTEYELQHPTQSDPATGNNHINNNCFRDPTFFRDPASGKPYLLFEANTGSGYCPEGSVKPEYLSPHARTTEGFRPTPNQLKANGCVGIVELGGDQLTNVRVLPPLLTANLVSDEIERITMLYRDCHYYLFCISRGSKSSATHQDAIDRNYMLGFRAKSLWGHYAPLNGNGVVIQQTNVLNSENNPQCVYSWSPLPNNRVLCYALHSAGNQGLTVGPSAVLDICGDKTRITGVEYNIKPAT